MTFDQAMKEIGFDWGAAYAAIYKRFGHSGLDYWEQCVFGRVVSR